jgi:small-conductance mechanosensitive channel
LGISFGEFHLNVGSVATAVVCLYGAIMVSYLIQAVLSETTYKDEAIEHGVRVSIFKIIHYAFVFIGFLLALMVLGVEMKSITIIGGALGLGIGFGLQGIVMNFIAGIILLFERPVKVGDRIIVNNQWGEIKNLGLRSTVVQMFDRSEIVIPNHDFISKNVTNWTLSDRVMRINVAVGVAYGSDVQQVIQVLNECAMASSKISRMPEPQVLFKKFGESSLDFELRAWIFNVDDFYLVTSFLHEEIEKRFRESGITIAFPQRDLHIRPMAAPSET